MHSNLSNLYIYALQISWSKFDVSNRFENQPSILQKLYACSCLGGKECEGLFRLCVNNIMITWDLNGYFCLICRQKIFLYYMDMMEVHFNGITLIEILDKGIVLLISFLAVFFPGSYYISIFMLLHVMVLQLSLNKSTQV